MVREAEGAGPDRSGRSFDTDVLVLHFGIRYLQKNSRLSQKNNADRRGGTKQYWRTMGDGYGTFGKVPLWCACGYHIFTLFLVW